MQPEPPPAAEPADTQPPLTHQDVEHIFQSLPPDTFIGKERDEDNTA
jgi:hypothetical protein